MSMLVNQLELLNQDGCQSDYDMYCAKLWDSMRDSSAESQQSERCNTKYIHVRTATYIYLSSQHTEHTPSSPVTTPTKPVTQNNKNQRTREEGPADRQCKTHQGEPASQAQSSTTSPSNRHSLNIPTIAKNETRTKNSKRKRRKENTYFEKRKSDPFICH